MTERKELPRIRLDWQKLVGFDQASRSAAEGDATRIADPRMALLGAKIGVKPGGKQT